MNLTTLTCLDYCQVDDIAISLSHMRMCFFGCIYIHVYLHVSSVDIVFCPLDFLTNFYRQHKTMLRFPKSSCILWDGTSTGPPCFLNISYYRLADLVCLHEVDCSVCN